MKEFKISEELRQIILHILNVGKFETITYQNLKELEKRLLTMEEVQVNKKEEVKKDK